jgi:hypothetical protein
MPSCPRLCGLESRESFALVRPLGGPGRVSVHSVRPDGVPVLVRAHRLLAASSALASVLLPAACLLPSPLRAATFDVTQATWGTAAQSQSFAWALAQANVNPGLDTIRISPGLQIDVDGATPGAGLWLAGVSDALAIEGNGATLVGNPSFLASSGTVYTKTNVDVFTPAPGGTDILLQQAFSFAKVDPGVSLSIERLGIDGLNGFVQLGNGGSATIANASARNTVSYGAAVRSVFEALDNSVLNLTNVVMDRINQPLLTIGAAWEGVVAGTNASLNMFASRISNAAAGAVVWGGGVANVVSSVIEASGGLSVRDDTSAGVMNLVNSLVSPTSQNPNLQRLQAIGGGELNIVASTIVQDALYNDYNGCNADPYVCGGKPLTALDGGAIRMRESVISLLNAEVPGLIPVGIESYSDAALGYASGGSLQAQDSVWIQVTPAQSAVDLAGLLGSQGLITTGVPFLLDDFGGGLSGYRPLPAGAVPNPAGPLIDRIADADGSNQLINPIDGSVIQFDLLGMPRTRLGRRDLGAIQAQDVPAPLPLAGAFAAFSGSRRLRRRLRQRL